MPLAGNAVSLSVPGLMKMTGGSQRGLLPAEGRVGTVPSRAPSSPGAPTGPKLFLSTRSEAARQLWGRSSAAPLQPAAQMCVFAQPSPGSEGALLSIMKGGL